MNHYNEFKIQYSVDRLANRLDELKTLQRKLDPSNFNGADTHLSIEEKYKIRFMLEVVMIDIEMLDYEVHRPTGEKKNVKKNYFRFWK